MSWQLVGAPSHVAPETGPNLLAGAGPWTVPLVLDGEYVLTVEVLGGGVVEWSVTGLDGEGEPVAVPGLSETVTDTEWARVTIPFTAPAFAGDATVTLTVPGESRNPELGELTGRTVLTVPGDVLAETIMASGGIIAGVEGGARVELNDTGLRAFDTAGVETARIQGEGGEFVGGEFRTSDNLPGQVTLADDAYIDMGSGNQYPGIRVEPFSLDGYLRPPGIGPNVNGMVISGGQGTSGSQVYTIMAQSAAQTIWRGGAGNRSALIAQSGTAQIQADDGDGSLGSVRATPLSGEAFANDSEGTVSIAGADTTRAMLYTRAGGSRRYLIVDESGIWAQTDESGEMKSYNLEETAQDSGWQSITLDSGFSGSASLAWRNKGGVIWFRGTVTGSWSGGSYDTVATLPAEVWPAYAYTVNEAGSTAGVLIRVQSDGRLEIRTPSAGTSTHRLTSLSYPIG